MVFVFILSPSPSIDSICPAVSFAVSKEDCASTAEVVLSTVAEDVAYLSNPKMQLAAYICEDLGFGWCPTEETPEEPTKIVA
eukprot:Awhi_evm1s12304